VAHLGSSNPGMSKSYSVVGSWAPGVPSLTLWFWYCFLDLLQLRKLCWGLQTAAAQLGFFSWLQCCLRLNERLPLCQTPSSMESSRGWVAGCVRLLAGITDDLQNLVTH
jgi:hypothetical protein